LVHFLFSRVVGISSAENDEQTIQNRLMLRSLADDGEFVRPYLRGLAASWVPKVEECLKVAVRTGEATDGLVRPVLQAWFVHHLATMITFQLLPEKPAVDYELSREQLIEQ